VQASERKREIACAILLIHAVALKDGVNHHVPDIEESTGNTEGNQRDNAHRKHLPITTATHNRIANPTYFPPIPNTYPSA
jgi:hypothetical protein